MYIHIYMYIFIIFYSVYYLSNNKEVSLTRRVTRYYVKKEELDSFGEMFALGLLPRWIFAPRRRPKLTLKSKTSPGGVLL